MKRWFSLLLTIVLSIMMVSCSKLTDLEVKKKKDPNDMLIQKEEKDLGKRVIDFSKSISDEGTYFSRSLDLDYDDKSEKIVIEVDQGEDAYGILKVTAGEKTAEVTVLSGVILNIYSCDIDPEDDARDIAVIVMEESGDVNLRIFSYKKDLSAYKFIMSDGSSSDTNGIHNVFENYIDINEKNVLTVEEKTNSTGMWSLYKKYKLNEEGHLEEINYKLYGISPDFMENCGQNIIDDKEKLMWNNGYIKAYAAYINGDFYIEEGEYFKVIYDNDQDVLHVEKEDGEEGYINLSDIFNKYELNPHYFWMAG